MSVVDKFYCECEKAVTDTPESIPKYIAIRTTHLGDRIFDEEVRKKLVQDCESTIRELETYAREIKSELDEYSSKLNEQFFWSSNIPNKLDNRKAFESTIFAVTGGMNPILTRKEGNMFKESFGSPQLREYVENKKIEAEIKIPATMHTISGLVREYDDICDLIEDTKKAVPQIEQFIPLIKSLGNTFDPYLAERFRERMILAKNGLRMQVG